MANLPYLGFGLGLRPKHYQTIIDTQPTNIDWFEMMTEDHLNPGGNLLYYAQQIRERYPMVMHGVSLAIGNYDPLNWDYLNAVKQLVNTINPIWVSDHLCWGGMNGKNSHDLLPLPHSEEAIKHVVARVKQVQDFLERQILLENVSTYVRYNLPGQLKEWDFLTEVAHQADCLILLDVNNIYVNSVNHEFDSADYLNGVPIDRVQQFHLAGHYDLGTHIIDTHDHDIVDPVWAVYREAVKRFGHVSTMIERDDHIPPLEELAKELYIARQIAISELGNIAPTQVKAVAVA